MRLISCNIYGFGALADYNIVFDSRLHSIFGPNGFGKSTLFDFIQVMLYGMPSTRANENSLSLRSHYRPFGGKTYGGVLTLDTREGVISIERVFHASSSTKDTLKITDTFGNDLTSGKYKNISSLGYHFLGLDEEAYERTVAFREIGASDGVGANKTISGKLNSIATSIDVGQYDRAIDALNEMIKSLSGKGTKNISTISRLNQEIQKLSKEIKELEGVRNSLEGYHQSLTGFKKDHSSLETEVEKARKINHERVLWENYKKLLLAVQQLRQELQSILDKYPQGIPSLETAQEIRRLAQELRTVEIALGNQEFTESESQKLAQLNERYPNGPIPMPTLEELGKTIYDRANALSQLDETQFSQADKLEELRSMFSRWQNPSIQALEQMLVKSKELDREAQDIESIQPIQPQSNSLNLNGSSIPSEEEMQRIESLANKYKNNELKIQALAAQPAPHKAKCNKPIAFLGLLMVVIGIVMQITGILNYGGAVMFFGLALFMFSFILKGSSNTNPQDNPAFALSQDNVELEHKLKTFFTRYQRYGTDFLAYYEELKNAIREYKEYLQKREEQQRNIQQAKASVETGRREVADFITNTVGLGVREILRLNTEDNTVHTNEGRGVNNVNSSNSASSESSTNAVGDQLDRIGDKPATDGAPGKVSDNQSAFAIGFDIDEALEDDNQSNVNNCSFVNAYKHNNSINVSKKSCYSYYDPSLRINMNLTQLLSSLLKEYQDLQHLQYEHEEVERKRRSFKEKAEECTEKINDILREYSITEEDLDLNRLRTESNDLENLRRESAKHHSRKQELTEAKDNLTQRIDSIYQSLSLSVPDDLTTASLKYEQDQQRCEELKVKINRQIQEAEEYRRSNALTEEPKVALTDQEIKEREQKIKELNNAITRLSDQITQAEQDTSALPSLNEQLQQKTNELKQAQDELEVVRKTQSFIIQANKNLLDRYVRPIMDRYQDQIKRILPWLESVTMDHNYKVSFKKDTDVAHNCEHLSSGERTCLELALRLALIENMYHEDYPVLMMDDPFAELDSENLEKALEILKGISSKMQVVYFSCSPERKLS